MKAVKEDNTKIIKGNKLIAIFEGYKLITPAMRREPETWKESYWEIKPEGHGTQVLGTENGLSYHRSWDWLIPVIDKITSMSEYFIYKEETSNIVSEGGIYINTKFISSTWDDVIGFIEWYNKTKA